MISVLIIDDHPVVLEGSKALFQELDDMLIETESNPQNVLNQMQNTNFDVFLVDVNMASKNGITLASDIKEAQENAFVILYTGDDISSYYSLIIEKKVDGILSKTASREKVIQTIYSILQGDFILPIDFIDHITKRLQNKYDNLKLNIKEKQLITLIMEGYTNKAIAEKLSVTQRTVERYLTQLFAILDVSSRKEAIELVQEKNLL